MHCCRQFVAWLTVLRGCCLVPDSSPRNARAPVTAAALTPQLCVEGRRGVLLDALIELQHLVFG
jgi:hypothetical protein